MNVMYLFHHLLRHLARVRVYPCRLFRSFDDLKGHTWGQRKQPIALYHFLDKCFFPKMFKKKIGGFYQNILPSNQVLKGVKLGKCNGKITLKQNVISSPDGTPTDRPQSIHWPSDAYSSIFILNKN